ncbi:class E sortase [Saccharothrix coeruleofusca]|uniref:LPXTG-site transpeptidase (Sortase) family protein n=1 Tax=Saccharothrix coeruleofusca TaxID=33919 RepID=A0A918AGZ2_9PSEU|nr:class E sortase [Saccharothrix coeruleofusca]GGP38207.1 hypothetical protein GCM10010185_07080 [Saccharothrix coeruleofusca]
MTQYTAPVPPAPVPAGPPRHSTEATRYVPPVPQAGATQYNANAFSGSLPPPRPQHPVQHPSQRPPQRPHQRPRPLPVDPPTEVIEPVRDEDEDDYGDDYGDKYSDDYSDAYGDDYEADAREEEKPPPPPPDGPGRKTVRAIGELLITAGLVMLLFVVYEVYVTDLISAGKQDDATAALDDQWNANTVGGDQQRQAQYELIEGQAFAKMYIPVFGPDFKFSIVEGTTDKHLEIGPGHYVGTALPGEPGNFSVAGHRVGKGAPFNDLDLLNSCDAIVVETQTQWFVYRMLPKNSEVANWASKASDPKCAKVAPLGGPYAQTQGQEIVLPSQGEVINEVPHVADGTTPKAEQIAMMTLTTCHPRFSDKQRLIVHAVLAMNYPKAPGFLPPELKEQ